MTQIWLGVDEDGSELVFSLVPKRSELHSGMWEFVGEGFVELPKGSIEKLLGRKLTWADEPVMMKD